MNKVSKNILLRGRKVAYFIIFLFLITNTKYSSNLMEIVGLTFSCFITLFFGEQLVEFIYSVWVGPWLGHNVNLRSMGKWALVTGASDGIGKAFAKKLAEKGLNLILLSRTQSKLDSLSKTLEAEYGIKTKVLAVDFTKGPELYSDIQDWINSLNLEIGVLINNVGMSYPYPEYFLDLPKREKFYSDIINCNVLSCTYMTSIILPQMLGRHKGVIVNVGSISSKTDTPYMALYGSTKSYMEKFTTDLSLEYKGTGVTLQYIYPSYVTTSMSRIKKSSWSVPNPEEFVEVAIKTIGLQETTAVWIPHIMICFCIKWAQVFRPEFAAESTRAIFKSLWLYGKKVALIKLNKSS